MRMLVNKVERRYSEHGDLLGRLWCEDEEGTKHFLVIDAKLMLGVNHLLSEGKWLDIEAKPWRWVLSIHPDSFVSRRIISFAEDGYDVRDDESSEDQR